MKNNVRTRPFVVRTVPAIGFGIILWASAVTGLAQVTVPVQDHSFETLGPAYNCNYSSGSCYYTINNIPDWNSGYNASQYGQLQPNGYPSGGIQFNNQTDPDVGATVGYINGSGYQNYTWIYQDVVPAASVVAGATYTLTIDLGEQNTQNAVGTPGCSPVGTATCDPGFFDYRAALVMPGIGSDYATGANPAPGSFGQFTATFVAPSVATGDLYIDIYGEDIPGLQLDFDNVALTETAAGSGTDPVGSAPEPGTVILAGGALALIAFVKRRRMC
jgi:hypothetical protein